jgi:hypothetical protein
MQSAARAASGAGAAGGGVGVGVGGSTSGVRGSGGAGVAMYTAAAQAASAPAARSSAAARAGAAMMRGTPAAVPRAGMSKTPDPTRPPPAAMVGMPRTTLSAPHDGGLLPSESAASLNVSSEELGMDIADARQLLSALISR